MLNDGASYVEFSYNKSIPNYSNLKIVFFGLFSEVIEIILSQNWEIWNLRKTVVQCVWIGVIWHAENESGFSFLVSPSLFPKNTQSYRFPSIFEISRWKYVDWSKCTRPTRISG